MVSSKDRKAKMLENQELEELLLQNPIFSDLNNEQKRLLSALADEKILSQGETLIQEGDTAEQFFIVIDGQLEIMKHSAENNEDYQITTLNTGQVVGELALIDDQKRSATVRALVPSQLASININKLRASPSMLNIHTLLVKNIAQSLAERLRSGNGAIVKALERELNQAKARIALGLFTVNTLILASLYSINMGVIVKLVSQVQSSTFISVPIILIFAILFLILMLRSSYPLETYGITVKNWKKSMWEATLFTLPVLAGLLLLKFIVFYPEIMQHKMNLLSFNPTLLKEEWVLMLMYACFCPLQELVARSGLQGSLYNFLAGSERKRHIISVLVSNLIFVQAHLPLGMTFALMTFIPGLFWGWMFARQKTLVGCSWSHVLIGIVGLFIIGFK